MFEPIAFAALSVFDATAAPMPADEVTTRLIGSFEETELPAWLDAGGVSDPGTGTFRLSDPLGTLVGGTLRHVQAVAAALPLDQEDERLIENFLARRRPSRASEPI